MKDRIVPFKEEYTESAVKLFIENYKKARAKNILLPNRVIDEPEWIINTPLTPIQVHV